MASISSPLQVDLSKVQKLSVILTPVKIEALDPAFKDMLTRLTQPAPKMDPLMADNHPSKLYAEIVKDGRVIGKVYKGGSCETSNAVGAKLRSFFAMTDDRDERAAAIAKATKGIIRYV